ncbi:MAG: TetR/AcrR family transcriptional regulator [bacterium]|nr:TetR/AcrR family transcriptional regulator [bacterium]
MQEELSTQDKILQAASLEFQEKGFLNASLRKIVKDAGVTTGAFYRYYDSKEALFEALVGEHATYILTLFGSTLSDFEQLSGEEQTEQMMQVSHDTLTEMLEYMYAHLESFRLLLMSAQGTIYADFTHQLTLLEVDSTYTYMKTLEAMGHRVKPLHEELVHMIASGLFTGIFECVIHNMPKEEAFEYVFQLKRFYSAGWSELLGVKFDGLSE